MKLIKTVGVTEALRKISTLVRNVKTKSTKYIISKYGDPKLILLSIPEYNKYKKRFSMVTALVPANSGT